MGGLATRTQKLLKFNSRSLEKTKLRKQSGSANDLMNLMTHLF